MAIFFFITLPPVLKTIDNKIAGFKRDPKECREQLRHHFQNAQGNQFVTYFTIPYTEHFVVSADKRKHNIWCTMLLTQIRASSPLWTERTYSKRGMSFPSEVFCVSILWWHDVHCRHWLAVCSRDSWEHEVKPPYGFIKGKFIMVTMNFNVCS